MPQTTPDIKVDAVRRLGGEVVLWGDSYADAYAHALELATTSGATFIHPFDDPLVIAGQGTVGDEIVRQRPGEFDRDFRAGGGRRRAAAMLATSRPCPRWRHRRDHGSPMRWYCSRQSAGGHIDEVGLFADGVAVREVGEHTFAIAQATVDEVVLVDTTRFAPQSRTCSTTRARSWSRPVPWP